MSPASASAKVMPEVPNDVGLEEGVLSDDAGDVLLLQGRPIAPRRRWLSRVVLAGGVVSAAAALALVGSTSSRNQAVEAETEAKVSLFGPLAAVALLSAGANYLPVLEKGVKQMGAPLKKVQEEVQNSKPLDHLERYTNLTAMEEIPDENLHDGNPCADDEEEIGGLCYDKCAGLTSGEYPVRTTPWSCCKATPCTFFNSKFTNPLIFCEGFDVSGAKEGRDCPHQPGACLVDEEFNLGMCFKKCAVLTNNKYPFRSAASTCCRYNSHWACLDPLNTMTSPDFNEGGGPHDDSVGSMHLPIAELTED